MADSGAAATSALSAAVTAMATAAPDSPGNCDGGNDYNGMMGLRISAIFVILVGSMFGAVFPTFAKRHQGVRVPTWTFFIAKFFGSGVIIATAFIHLLAPANDALTDPCLTGPITDYDWVEGIALISVFVLFIVELMAMRYAVFDPHGHDPDHQTVMSNVMPAGPDVDELHSKGDQIQADSPRVGSLTHARGEDHLSHVREHPDSDSEAALGKHVEDYGAQITAIFILEFGIIFHSIFIGLTLAVSGDEFQTLYVVLVFHQTFEGLGLGARLATVPWPKSKRWTPYLLGVGYALSTPIAIAVGLGIRGTYAPGSQTALITNGVFDSISAGILIYTGLVELMAHEFMFSENMRKASLRVVLSALGLMVLGAGLMALLGKWA